MLQYYINIIYINIKYVCDINLKNLKYYDWKLKNLKMSAS